MLRAGSALSCLAMLAAVSQIGVSSECGSVLLCTAVSMLSGDVVTSAVVTWLMVRSLEWISVLLKVHGAEQCEVK
jgi:hypothetical protein